MLGHFKLTVASYFPWYSFCIAMILNQNPTEVTTGRGGGRSLELTKWPSRGRAY